MTDESCKLVTYMMMESENEYVILIKCFDISVEIQFSNNQQ